MHLIFSHRKRDLEDAADYVDTARSEADSPKQNYPSQRTLNRTSNGKSWPNLKIQI